MKFLFHIAFCLLPILAFSQKAKPTGKPTNAINLNEHYFGTTSFRQIGPFRGGRADAIVGSYSNKQTFYMGATGGGVWKTIDAGNNWKNISDGYFGGSIGAVALAPSNESILYAGEGENTLRGNVSEGLNGIWKSTDGGRTWKNKGLANTRHIAKIIVDPKNELITWVAAIGHLFGKNEERGVYKTVDGGNTWQKVLYVSDSVGIIDMAIEPSNPQTIYATAWNIKRTPYSLESGGQGSGIYKSVDGGITWNNITPSLKLPPTDAIGIIGITVSAINPDKVFALVESKKGGLFKSENGGKDWVKVSEDANIRQRAWYFSRIYCDPLNEETIYAMNVGMYKSTDGGKTFKGIRTGHSDHHDMWIDPKDPNRLGLANDGGAQVSFDGGANWSSLNNQPTGQFYRVSTDNSFPYRILGAQQDNSTVRIKSSTYTGEISNQDWEPTAGSESGYVVADPLNNDIVYGGNYGGYLSRLNHKTGENRAITVWPENPMGSGADALKYRFQWNFPILFSPHNSKKLYAAGNQLFATETEGSSWQAISPDLTRNEKYKQIASGGPITKDNTSVEYYATIFTVAESPLEKDVIYTGSDDGLLYITKDGGQNWKNITPSNAPKYIMWNCIEINPFNKSSLYVVGTAYKSDDFAPYIFTSNDYGNTWQLITNGINSTHFARSIRADRKVPNLLYAGTEFGLYISYNTGIQWNAFQRNLPIVPITDIALKNNDLIVATQGRSFWVLDDLSLVQQYNNSFDSTKLQLINAAPSYRKEGYVSKQKNVGENAPNGASINYFLPKYDEADTLTITIRNANNVLLKKYSNKESNNALKITATAHMNKQVWDMNYTDVEKIDGMILWNGNVEGPKAIPGNYKVTVKHNNDSASVSLTTLADPNYATTQEDYTLQENFLLQVKNSFAAIQKAIKDIRTLRTQLSNISSQLDSNQLQKNISKKIDSAQKKLTAIEEALYQTKAKSGQDVLNYPIKLNDKIAGIYGEANSGYTKPNKQLYDAFDYLNSLVSLQLNALSNVKNTEISEINAALHAANVPIIGTK